MAKSIRDNHENLLFLTDEQLRSGIEAMFFAYRDFTADPDKILKKMGYGRAHHRALYFIQRASGTNVSNLMSILGITKQSLNRVLRDLIHDGLAEVKTSQHDKRVRNLYLTPKGQKIEQDLVGAQSTRMRAAYRLAGAQAVAGFRQVLEAMMDHEHITQHHRLGEGSMT